MFIPLGMERLVLKSNILYTRFSLVSPYNCFSEPVGHNSELYCEILRATKSSSLLKMSTAV